MTDGACNQTAASCRCGLPKGKTIDPDKLVGEAQELWEAGYIAGRAALAREIARTLHIDLDLERAHRDDDDG